jgi:hypothetical protein
VLSLRSTKSPESSDEDTRTLNKRLVWSCFLDHGQTTNNAASVVKGDERQNEWNVTETVVTTRTKEKVTKGGGRKWK